MSGEWLYYGFFITTDMAIGSAMAAALDPDSGGAQSFVRGTELRVIGSGSQTPTAWICGSPMKQSGYDAVNAFLAGQLHPNLAAKGMTQEQITTAQPKPDLSQPQVRALIGPRATTEGQANAFIAAQGFERMPA